MGFVIAQLKPGTWDDLPDSTKWVAAGILVAIGVFFLFMTYGSMIQYKIKKVHSSGVPLVGGFFVLIGFLLSPIKWLALLALLDPGVWMLPYAIYLSHKEKKENKGEGKE